MQQKRSGPAAGNDEAGCFGGNGSLLTKSNPKSPVREELNGASPSALATAQQAVTIQRIVRADLGPVNVLAKGGCEPPGVAIERTPNRTIVLVENAPRGYPGGANLREFPANDPRAVSYAFKLGRALREAALIEQGRRVRNRELAQRERDAMLASRRDGGR